MWIFVKRTIGAAAFGGLLATASMSGAATFSYSTDFAAGVGPEWLITANVHVPQPGILGAIGHGGASATLTQSAVGASAANGGILKFDVVGFGGYAGTSGVGGISGAFGGGGFTDIFDMIINGATVFRATWNLGGGGGDHVIFNPNGASVTGTGRFRSVTLPFTVLSGDNNFKFSYPTLTSFMDESFGLDNVSVLAQVRDPISGGVPEPATWAMMLMGFVALGSALRFRRLRLRLRLRLR